jgi:uncharacterized protein (DUF2336 family)
MYHHKSLISELEDSVRRGSQRKRVESLRRVTDLFLGESEKLNEEQIEVFDEILSHLIARAESKALVELSERLAPVNNAPIKVINTLARDDEIAIAGPILSMSERLTARDLIEIAKAKSQAHLLAISKRSSLSEALTDALVERGDRQVVGRLAENAGARFSEKAYTRLVDQADTDETLLEKLGLRLDIPLHIFRRLLERVTGAVRSRLLAMATPEKRDDIKDLLAGISSDVIEQEPTGNDFESARRLIDLMQKNDELDQVALLEFARTRRFAETVTALATLCSAPVDMIKQMLSDGRNEALLVPCKAAGISWPTLRALLQDDVVGKIVPDDELKKLKLDYLKLSPATAKRVLGFWRTQQAPHGKLV